jgi:hypothetical protein
LFALPFRDGQFRSAVHHGGKIFAGGFVLPDCIGVFCTIGFVLFDGGFIVGGSFLFRKWV